MICSTLFFGTLFEKNWKWFPWDKACNQYKLMVTNNREAWRKLKKKLFVIVTYSMLPSLLPGLRHLDLLPNLSYTTYLLRFIIHFDIVMSFIFGCHPYRCVH
jgi:hypothetical protein